MECPKENVMRFLEQTIIIAISIFSKTEEKDLKTGNIFQLQSIRNRDDAYSFEFPMAKF